VAAEKTLTGGTIVIEEEETVEGFVAMGGEIIVKGIVEDGVTASCRCWGRNADPWVGHMPPSL